MTTCKRQVVGVADGVAVAGAPNRERPVGELAKAIFCTLVVSKLTFPVYFPRLLSGDLRRSFLSRKNVSPVGVR